MTTPPKKTHTTTNSLYRIKNVVYVTMGLILKAY